MSHKRKLRKVEFTIKCLALTAKERRRVKRKIKRRLPRHWIIYGMEVKT
jgi:hypothetical protein